MVSVASVIVSVALVLFDSMVVGGAFVTGSVLMVGVAMRLLVSMVGGNSESHSLSVFL
jgi:uncharacterized membrane protein